METRSMIEESPFTMSLKSLTEIKGKEGEALKQNILDILKKVPTDKNFLDAYMGTDLRELYSFLARVYDYLETRDLEKQPYVEVKILHHLFYGVEKKLAQEEKKEIWRFSDLVGTTEGLNCKDLRAALTPLGLSTTPVYSSFTSSVLFKPAPTNRLDNGPPPLADLIKKGRKMGNP